MTKTIPVIAIIGAGNMGSSLIGGLINNHHPSDKLWATDSDEAKLAHLAHAFNIHTTTNNVAAVEAADVVLFAIKPQLIANIVTQLADTLRQRRPLIISIVAGIREKSLQQWIGSQIAIVRAMPNSPALIGCGATALYANPHTSVNERNMAESILRSVGIVVWLTDEKLMDVVTSLSGNGPAYFFLMMEALQQAACELGLPEDIARLLTLQTALGASRMAIESGKPLAELRRHVTSPGGTTESALSVLEENNIRGIFKKTLQAAKLRSEELAEIMGKN